MTEQHQCGHAVALVPWRTKIGDVHDPETAGDLGVVLTQMRAKNTLDAARRGHRLEGTSTAVFRPGVDSHEACTPDHCTSLVDVGGVQIPLPILGGVATWLVMVTRITCARAEVTING